MGEGSLLVSSAGSGPQHSQSSSAHTQQIQTQSRINIMLTIYQYLHILHSLQCGYIYAADCFHPEKAKSIMGQDGVCYQNAPTC